MRPLHVPVGAFGLLITTVEEQFGAVLCGAWLLDPDWSEREDGEVIATLGTCRFHDSTLKGTHLEAYLLHAGTALHLGSWCSLGAEWPETLRHPANAATRLHAQLREVGFACDAHAEP